MAAGERTQGHKLEVGEAAVGSPVDGQAVASAARRDCEMGAQVRRVGSGTRSTWNEKEAKFCHGSGWRGWRGRPVQAV